MHWTVRRNRHLRCGRRVDALAERLAVALAVSRCLPLGAVLRKNLLIQRFGRRHQRRQLLRRFRRDVHRVLAVRGEKKLYHCLLHPLSLVETDNCVRVRLLYAWLADARKPTHTERKNSYPKMGNAAFWG